MAILALCFGLLHLLGRVEGGAPFANVTDSNLDANYSNPQAGAVTTGLEYASSCLASSASWSSANKAWNKAHQTITTQPDVLGGPTTTTLTLYANATTLADGHPRVAHSPAISIGTKVTVTNPGNIPASTSNYVGTIFQAYPSPSPTCKIGANDCDALYRSYTTALASWSRNVTDEGNRPKPTTPPCLNNSQIASNSIFSESFYGCGGCTLYGNDVKLMYFPVPTTVYRNMSASTPTAKMTAVEDNDPDITAYAGKSYGHGTPAAPGAVTAVVDSHTLTSGTAYISIAQVYAQDRCTRNIGSTVSDVILAMPSASVLSIRYSQNHFNYFATSSYQSGYPVSYADFNTPIPWSAWNGQQPCYGPDWNDRCDIIYEDNYRPQLAMPGAIKKLDDKWSTCQFWYGGLYDPPLVLQTQKSLDTPTTTHNGNGGGSAPTPYTTTSASPNLAAPASSPTGPAAATPPAGSGNTGSDSGSGSGGGSGSDPNTGSASSGSSSGSTGGDSGGNSGNSGSNPGGNSGSNSGGNAGSNSGSNSGGNAGANSGSNAGANSGGNSGSNSGSGSGNNAGGDSVGTTGSNAGGNPRQGSGSVSGGSSGQNSGGNSGTNQDGGSGQNSGSGSDSSSSGNAQIKFGSDGKATVTFDGNTITVTSVSNGVVVGSQTITPGATAVPVANGVYASVNQATGLVLIAASTIALTAQAAATRGAVAGSIPSTQTLVFERLCMSALQSAQGEATNAVIIGTVTLSQGGPVQTIAPDVIATLGPNGVVIESSSQIGFATASTSSSGSRISSVRASKTSGTVSSSGTGTAYTAGSSADTAAKTTSTKKSIAGRIDPGAFGVVLGMAGVVAALVAI